jgi:hypothetical protein
MDERFIGGFVSEASVEDLQQLLKELDEGAQGSGQRSELLAALRRDPDGLGDYFRMAAGMKIASQGGR